VTAVLDRESVLPARTDGLRIRHRYGRLDYVHFCDDRYVYASRRNNVYRKAHDGARFELVARLPVRRPADRLLLATKLTRRVFRKRVENVVALPTGTVVAVMGGRIFRLRDGQAPELVFELVRGRGTMHGGLAVTDDGELFLGEYWRNRGRETVRIARGTSDGARWTIGYESDPGKFRYYHGCFWDPFERKLWLTTGDDPQENFIARADTAFRNVEYIGDGSKHYSAARLLFTKDHVYFANTNHYGRNYLCRLDRASHQVQRLARIHGPSWYGYQTSDGWLLFSSNVEHCPDRQDRYVHLYASRDGDTWRDVGRWRKDLWAPWGVFLFGVLNFPGGKPRPASDVWFSGQALSGMSLGVARAEVVPA
jgi:hypothetical protein